MNDVIENNNKVVSKAIGKMIRISPYKLNLEAKSIRGKKVDEALSYLEFSKKRISHTVKGILESAIANAETFSFLAYTKVFSSFLTRTAEFFTSTSKSCSGNVLATRARALAIFKCSS